MGGRHSTPPPRIIYRTDPKTIAAMKAAEDRAKATAAQERQHNAAMQKRMEQMESRNAENQRAMTEAMRHMAETSQRNNSAQLVEMKKSHDQQIAATNQKRAEMETRFQQEMKAAAEENRAVLAREQQQHRAEQARLEKEGAQNRLVELQKQHELIGTSLIALDEDIVNVNALLHDEEEKLECVKTFLLIEMTARAKFEHVDIDGNTHKIVMLGNTGDGKSTLGNRLTGDESKKGDSGTFVTGSGVESVTEEIKTAFSRYRDFQFCIADTPGGGDHGGRDRIFATQLVDFLHGIGAVDAFLLVRNVTNPRLMSQHNQDILGALTSLLGAEFWQNVVIVCSRVDDEDEMKDLEDAQGRLSRALGQMFHLPEHVVEGIQVVGIGKRNFREQVPQVYEAVLRCNDGSPFVCEDLVAPVEERQADCDEQQQVVDGVRRRLQELAMRKGHLESTQSQVERFIQEIMSR